MNNLTPVLAPYSTLFSQLLGSLSIGLIVTWGLYAVFAFWALYTLIAIYHWLKYSNSSLLAFPAIAVHLYISFALMSYALNGNAFLLTRYLP